MKNAKKILCLVLALAMCLGLGVTASAASLNDFPDASEVTYNEELGLMVSIGIINGADGYLKPGDTVTREQAAKMIAYSCVGKTAAESLPKTGGVFGDVEEGRWSAGYIAYCAANGIINGVGDTNGDGKPEFNPTGNVTGYQFVKMLLGAVGYGEKGEFVGSGWKQNTSTFGYRTGAFDGSNAASYNDPATREEAMLYAFNVLTKVMTVKYSEILGGYYSGSSPLTVIDENDEYLHTLAYKVYKLYKSSEVDAFGRPYSVWRQNGKELTDRCYSDTKLTFTEEVSSAELYTALGKAYAGDAEYFVNGEEAGIFPIAKNDLSDTVGGRGVATMVYADENTKHVTILSVPTYLGVVAKIRNDDATVTVYDGSNGTVFENVAGTYSYELTDADHIERGDRVLVILANGEIESMKEADTVKGVLTASSENYLKVDGERYYKAATFGGMEYAETEGDYAGTCIFYIDSYGNVLGSELYEAAKAPAEDYIYITASEYTTGILSRKAAIAVQHLDGKEGILYLNTWTDDGKVYYSNCGTETEITANAGEAITDLAVPGFYRCVTERNGSVTLKAADTGRMGAAGFVSAQIYAQSGTKELVVGETPDFGSVPDTLYLNKSSVLHILGNDGSAATVTGYNEIRGYFEESADYLVLYSGRIVSDIYVFGGHFTRSAVSGLYTGEWHRSGDGTHYSFLVDGVPTDLKLGVSAALTENTLYTFKEENGVITEIQEADGKAAATEITNIHTDRFIADGDTYYYGDNVKIFDATAAGSEAELSAGDIVAFCMKDGMVDTVYILSR